MHNIKNILFPTDFSVVAENAFQHALAWATQYQANIHVQTVVNPYIPVGEYGQGVAVAVETITEVEVGLKTKLKRFIEAGIAKWTLEKHHYNGNGNSNGNGNGNGYLPNISLSVETGTPENTICTKAEKGNFDLILMGTRGENHDFWDKIFGTVSHFVVENANVPVLLIPPKVKHKPITRVVYAADLTATQPFRIWQTYELLKVMQPKLHCVHVPSGKSPREIHLYELDNYFKSAHPTLPIQFHLVHLDSIEEGMRFAIDLWNAELLCMYTPQHSIFRQLFAHSNSHNAIDYMDIPILFVKQ
jgi:nucleotide-binding universal stress UspA family protein